MKKLIALFLVFTVVSCVKSPLNETYEFRDNRWGVTDVKEFKFEIEEDTTFKGLVLTLSHVYEPGYDAIPLLVKISGPQGSEELPLDIELKGTGGKPNAECLGDICDLGYYVKKDWKLSKGSYSITVENKFPVAAYLPNIIAMKMTLE